jgi:hypothetical protein
MYEYTICQAKKISAYRAAWGVHMHSKLSGPYYTDFPYIGL